MNLGELIKKDIKENGVRQSWLAEKLGVSPVTVINILKGNRAGNKTLRAIAAHYNIPIKKVVEMNKNQKGGDGYQGHE